MATYVIGLVLLIIALMAARHLQNNLKTGKSDCCGCSGDCGCQCGAVSKGSDKGSCCH